MLNKMLVVDDHIALAKTIETVLVDVGFNSIIEHKVEDGLQPTGSRQPYLAFLGMMVPNMGSLPIRWNSDKFSDIPIFLLKVSGDLTNSVRGLETGAAVDLSASLVEIDGREAVPKKRSNCWLHWLETPVR